MATSATTSGNGKAKDPYAVTYLPIGKIKPSPENDKLYGEVQDDEQMDALVDSIKRCGLDCPLTLTKDHFVLSGHRRLYAVQRLGWDKVPVRIRKDIARHGNTEFHRQLAEFNPQRIKTAGSLLREALLRSADIADTYSALEHRAEAALNVDAEFLDVGRSKEITPISKRRLPFLEAVQKVIESLEDFWPLSIRQIHYKLLNDPPLKQAPKRSKYDAEVYRYRNDKDSYNSLVDLLESARYHGQVSMLCIDDPTRPQETWRAFSSLSEFIHQETEILLCGYHIDRQLEQPRHIEVFAEKNTLYRIVSKACVGYTVPFAIGRGFCSIPVWRDMAARFRNSDKERMTLIIVSDYDPEGLELADDAIRSLTLHDVPVDGHRIAVTPEQIEELGLAEDFNPAKDTSTRYHSFVKRTGGKRCWEVEALPPDYLVEQIKAAIEANMDMEIYGAVCDREEKDRENLRQTRTAIAEQLEF